MSADQSAPDTIDAYIAAFSPEVQTLLQQIRQVIHETLPGLGETISYGMPTFTLNGKYLVYIAAHKKHIGLYPAPTGVEEFQEAIARYGGGKGTLKFPFDQPMPFDLIRTIVQFRAREQAEKAAAKEKKA
jgi:uncharacterized protein YdhG (YjbR/CyaY superfamily)